MNSKNHMETHNSILFVRKNLKINLLKKKVWQNYRGVLHSECNLKNSVPKNIPIFFDNGLNYDNYFKRAGRRT